jgi:tetratricopeptide (TPR) repeat protein
MIKSLNLTLVLFFFLFSCTYHSREAKEILTKAENLVEAYPDSALALLDSIHYPNELSRPLLADYILLTTRAKDKAYQDISKDTLIFQIKDYFLKKRDWEKTVLAEFYSGRVYQSQQEYEEAMHAYLTAETLSKKIQDDNLKGLIQYNIGGLYYDELLYSKAIERLQSAYEYFHKSPDNYKREILTYNMVGTCYFLLDNSENHAELKDTALSYFEKALQLAEMHSDSEQVARIRQNLGVVFLVTNATKKAKEQLFQALTLSFQTEIQTKIYLNLAKTYNQENRRDSALYFANRSLHLLEKANDKLALLSTYRLLSHLEEKNNNYLNALQYNQQYLHYYDSIQVEKGNTNLLELQKKYDYELVKGANNRLIIQRQWIGLILFLLLICIIVISFIFYRKNQQNKDALSEAKQAIYQLKVMADDADNSIYPFLARQFDIVKKVSLLEGYLKEEDKEKGKEVLKKVNKIIYEKDSFDWDVLYQAMNKLHKGHLNKIQETFPNLSELEYKICCLTKSGLNNTEIAILLKSNVNIIQIRKTAIRKKLGIPEHGDIAGFMDAVIDKTH